MVELFGSHKQRRPNTGRGPWPGLLASTWRWCDPASRVRSKPPSQAAEHGRSEGSLLCLSVSRSAGPATRPTPSLVAYFQGQRGFRRETGGCEAGLNLGRRTAGRPCDSPRRTEDDPCDCCLTDPETGVASGNTEAAICVQDVDVQCVLQFTLIHAAGCALHRHTCRVIHRLELYSLFFLSRAMEARLRPQRDRRGPCP